MTREKWKQVVFPCRLCEAVYPTRKGAIRCCADADRFDDDDLDWDA